MIFEQMHYAYEHTELFNVEIDKLKPYFGPIARQFLQDPSSC